MASDQPVAGSAQDGDEDRGEEDGEQEEDGGETELHIGDGGALGPRFVAKHV